MNGEAMLGFLKEKCQLLLKRWELVVNGEQMRTWNEVYMYRQSPGSD
jgi:hypothetical protein